MKRFVFGLVFLASISLFVAGIANAMPPPMPFPMGEHVVCTIPDMMGAPVYAIVSENVTFVPSEEYSDHKIQPITMREFFLVKRQTVSPGGVDPKVHIPHLIHVPNGYYFNIGLGGRGGAIHFIAIQGRDGAPGYSLLDFNSTEFPEFNTGGPSKDYECKFIEKRYQGGPIPLEKRQQTIESIDQPLRGIRR